jgi:hypothetical protein
MHLSHWQVFSPRLPADPATALKSQTSERTMLHHHQRRAAVAIPLPKRLPKDVRPAIEAAIEQHQAAMTGLIALLDAFDGDTDLEPSLGAQDPAWGSTNQELWAHSNGDDREGDEHDGREPDVDDEPSLAHSNDLNQEAARRHLTDLRFPGRAWATADADLEAEHDGREPEAHT